MRLTDKLDHLILAAACDDFMTLEVIADKLTNSDGWISGDFDSGQVEDHVLNLISDKLMNAYLLHADPPYITPLDIGYGAISTGWFYITQRGRKCLRNLSRHHADGPEEDVTPPEESEYTAAVNF